MKPLQMGKTLFAAAGALILATVVSPKVDAASLTCPETLQAGQNNTYTISNAGATRPVDCVWGSATSGPNANIGQGSGDGFLAGTGVNDIGNTLFPATEAPTNEERFNLAWTEIGDTSGWSNGPTSSVTGLSFSNSTNTSTNFAINGALLPGYTAFALGIKDGSNPFWAVFLLRNLQGGLSGVASMTGGGFSHFVLYGTTGDFPEPRDVPVPEPASMVLLGLGFLGAGLARRRR